MIQSWCDTRHPVDTLPSEETPPPLPTRINYIGHITCEQRASGRWWPKQGRKEGRREGGRSPLCSFLLFSRIKCPSHSGFGSLREGKWDMRVTKGSRWWLGQINTPVTVHCFVTLFKWCFWIISKNIQGIFYYARAKLNRCWNNGNKLGKAKL